jgi:hypothetical protein
MVAVMVAMALFATIAVMASQSFRNINTTGRRAEAAMSAHDVESVIVGSMVQRYKDFVRGRCSGDPNIFFLGDIGSLTSVTMKNPVFRDSSNNTMSPPSTVAQQDVDRCNQTSFSKVTPASADSFYGCYNLTTVAATREKATHNSFAANRGAFIEIYVRLRNLQTDALATCTSIMNDRGFGMEVYYSLHWTTPSGNSTLYDSKTGTLNAAL